MCAGLCYWLATWFCGAATNSGWFARVWQSDEGLPGNNVSGIEQTPDGWLWIATHSGLVKFDGIRFYPVPLSIPSERSRPLIRSMLQDRENRLWLALEGSMVIRVGGNGTEVFTATNGLPNFRPLGIVQESQGVVWITYADGSACRVADGEVTRFTARDGLGGLGACVFAVDIKGNLWFTKAGQLGIRSGERFTSLHRLPAQVSQIGVARDGGVWICSGLELLRCKDTNQAPTRVVRLPGGRAGTQPSVVFEDSAGRVWVGTSIGGIFLWESGQLHHVGTSHNDILAIQEDAEKNIWVGTDGGGLDRLRPRVLELQGAEQGLPLATLRSITQDTEGVLWAVAQNGELTRTEGNRWKVVTTNEGWLGVRATCVLKDPLAGIWVGTQRGGLVRMAGTNRTVFGRSEGLAGDLLRALFIDSETNLWLGVESSTCLQRFRNGRFQTYSQPAGSRAIRAIAQDTRGVVWLGTQDGYLLRVEEDRLVNETPSTLSLPKPIRFLGPTADGSLWIGYAGAGLGRLKAGQFKKLGLEEGLADTYLCGFLPDAFGNWWFASDRGLFRAREADLESVAEGRAESFRSVTYGRDDALPNLQANYGYSPGCIRTGDGRLWFPMRSGLAVVHPSRLDATREPPRVAIERVLIDSRPVDWPERGPRVVPPDHRRLEFDFTALTFIDPEGVRFRFQVEGWDTDWQEEQVTRRATYSRLPAGEYVFRLTACNSAGEWNSTGAAVHFKVQPFVSQTWWFRLSLLGLFTAGLMAVVRYASYRRLQARLRSLEQEAHLQRERVRIAKDIHDDLGSSLTQISLIGKLAEQDIADPSKARAHVDRIAAIARQGVKSVDEIVWAVNPRNDTLVHLLDYAGQHAVDFLRAAGVRCRVDFPNRPPDVVLAADLRHHLFMSIKEALNNIVKHAHATEVRLLAKVETGVLRLSIEDNGRGFEEAPENALSDGLRNMRQRLSESGGHCEVESLPGVGTKITVEAPLSQASPPANTKAIL